MATVTATSPTSPIIVLAGETIDPYTGVNFSVAALTSITDSTNGILRLGLSSVPGTSLGTINPDTNYGLNISNPLIGFPVGYYIAIGPTEPDIYPNQFLAGTTYTAPSLSPGQSATIISNVQYATSASAAPLASASVTIDVVTAPLVTGVPVNAAAVTVGTTIHPFANIVITDTDMGTATQVSANVTGDFGAADTNPNLDYLIGSGSFGPGNYTTIPHGTAVFSATDVATLQSELRSLSYTPSSLVNGAAPVSFAVYVTDDSNLTSYTGATSLTTGVNTTVTVNPAVTTATPTSTTPATTTTPTITATASAPTSITLSAGQTINLSNLQINVSNPGTVLPNVGYTGTLTVSDGDSRNPAITSSGALNPGVSALVSTVGIPGTFQAYNYDVVVGPTDPDITPDMFLSGTTYTAPTLAQGQGEEININASYVEDG